MAISDSTAAAYSNYNVRSELATNAVRQSNEQEQQVAERLDKSAREQSQAQDTQQNRREARKIPGLGEAVDISA
ncbi:MAG: hypothetical protein HWE23_17055 [Rhodobacteraceae bacterium]|nr:hypothetical protein [Paracoccaceae bacterium]